MNLTVLEAAGIDTAEALGRVMGNETLFGRVLGMFLDDPNHDALVAAVAARDTEGAIKASHALKGTCGTLAMTELFKLLETQLALLRGDAFDGPPRSCRASTSATMPYARLSVLHARRNGTRSDEADRQRRVEEHIRQTRTPNAAAGAKAHADAP